MEWVFYTRTPYLYECGVLHRLSLLRSFHNLQLDRRNNLTLSFCTNPSLGVDGTTLSIMAQVISKDEQLKKDIKSELLGKTAYLKPNHIPFICKQVTGNIIFLSHQPDVNESSIDAWTEINCSTEVIASEQTNETTIEIPGLIAKFNVNIEYQQGVRTLAISNISLSEHPDD